MAYCAKCLHRDLCKSCDSCCGSVPGCKQFIDREALAEKFNELLELIAQLRKKLEGGDVQSL